MEVLKQSVASLGFKSNFELFVGLRQGPPLTYEWGDSLEKVSEVIGHPLVNLIEVLEVIGHPLVNLIEGSEVIGNQWWAKFRQSDLPIMIR